jgi:hypothetical protein
MRFAIARNRFVYASINKDIAGNNNAGVVIDNSIKSVSAKLATNAEAAARLRLLKKNGLVSTILTQIYSHYYANTVPPSVTS